MAMPQSSPFHPTIPIEMHMHPVFTTAEAVESKTGQNCHSKGRIDMETASTCYRAASLVASLVVLTVISCPLAAQQPAVNPSPPVQPAVPPSAQPGAGPGSTPLVNAPPAGQAQTPPSWQQGMPAGDEAAKLAPVPALPIATAADKLPVTKLKLPKNFNIEIYAAGLTNARSLRIDNKGNVFVSTRVLDRLYAVTDKNGKKEVKMLATGLNSPNGIALHKGTLYIAEINKISKIENIANQLDNAPKPTVVYDDLPSDAP